MALCAKFGVTPPLTSGAQRRVDVALVTDRGKNHAELPFAVHFDCAAGLLPILTSNLTFGGWESAFRQRGRTGGID